MTPLSPEDCLPGRMLDTTQKKYIVCSSLLNWNEEVGRWRGDGGGVYPGVLQISPGGGIITVQSKFPQGELTSVYEKCCLRDPTGSHVTHLMLWIPGTVGMVQNP